MDEIFERFKAKVRERVSCPGAARNEHLPLLNGTAAAVPPRRSDGQFRDADVGLTRCLRARFVFWTCAGVIGGGGQARETSVVHPDFVAVKTRLTQLKNFLELRSDYLQPQPKSNKPKDEKYISVLLLLLLLLYQLNGGGSSDWG